MNIEIVEDAPEALAEYEKVPIAFRVESYFRVELCENGLRGINFIEEAVAPYIKDYDAHADYRPTCWTQRFDISGWGILSAFDGRKRVGGAAIVANSPEIEMLEGLNDLACLWDLRVRPDYRKQGVGRALFARALEWSKARGCRLLKVETQNINVPACRFYARQGCELGTINRYAYPEFPNEIQMVWYKNV